MLAAVVGDDAMDDGQAEAGALAERAAERLEDRVDILGRDADAFIFDQQHGDAARRRALRATALRHSVPPLGIARKPLVARFQMICRIWPSSASTITGIVGLLHLDFVSLLDLGAVAQQHRRLLHDRTQIELLQREALRPRVGEERLDRLVEALRLLQHDVHQLRLVARQRQLLLEHLHRAGHRRERVADLVRDAGGHFADRRQALLQARVLLEALDVGDVLERVEIAARAVGQRQRGDAQARAR